MLTFLLGAFIGHGVQRNIILENLEFNCMDSYLMLRVARAQWKDRRDAIIQWAKDNDLGEVRGMPGIVDTPEAGDLINDAFGRTKELSVIEQRLVKIATNILSQVETNDEFVRWAFSLWHATSKLKPHHRTGTY